MLQTTKKGIVSIGQRFTSFNLNRLQMERLESSIGEHDKNGCLIWNGDLTSAGVPRFRFQKGLIKYEVSAIKLVYYVKTGKLLTSHFRQCRNIKCVEPKHILDSNPFNKAPGRPKKEMRHAS